MVPSPLQRRHLLAFQQQQRRHAGTLPCRRQSPCVACIGRVPQPNLAPLSLISSRNTYSSGVSRSASTWCSRPLIFNVVVMVVSSWLVSLRWIGRGITWSRRCLEKYSLRTSGVLDRLFNAGPCRLVAEARAQIIQNGCNLIVGHAVRKARHDRTAFALERDADARLMTILATLRGSGPLDRGREAKIGRSPIGQRPASLRWRVPTGGRVDRGPRAASVLGRRNGRRHYG